MLSAAFGGTTGVRLDWNESPLGPAPAAVERVAANAATLHRYPRGLLGSVTAAVAEECGVAPESVLLTNGVDEAVDLVLGLVEAAWFVTPGFDGYSDRARTLGRKTYPIALDAEWQPSVTPAELAGNGAVFLAQPHNPTGSLFPQDWVREVIDVAELTVLDTTYAEFATQPLPDESFADQPRLLRFHSFSKAHGLAGIRLGALIGTPELIAKLGSRQRFHSVDSVALHAIAGALEDPAHRTRFREHVLAERPRYVAALSESPLFAEVRDTQANFVVARCTERLSAAELTDRLADRDVWVRDCGSLGMPGWLRITVGTADDLRALTAALNDIEHLLAAPEPLSRKGKPMVAQDFEHRLVEALNPIRHLALAQALYVVMDNGVYDTVDTEPGLLATTIAERHGLDPERFTMLCHYLANEGYLVNEDGWSLTDKARALAPFRPWYTLLVGGYAETFVQLGAALKAGAPFASRDGAKVGAGSCGMSMFDVLPMADRLLDTLPADGLTVVDLGCGDAAFLIELVRRRPGLRAVGIEPDPVSSRLAGELVERAGLADRITIHHGRAADAVTVELPTDGSLCFLTAFVLQEMLQQEDEAAVEALLRKTMDNYRDAHWLVVEVDHQLDDRRSMAHALSQSYYNPYFLLHAITEQRLEKREFWDRLFSRAGLEVAAFDHPDENVDSTGLELGYLLRRA